MKTDLLKRITPKASHAQDPFFKPETKNGYESQTTRPGLANSIKSHPNPYFFQPKVSTEPAPKDAPAWSRDGSIFLGTGFFAASPDKQTEMLQHESVHALHQRSAPTDNSDAARNYAENLANNPVQANAIALAVPTPAVLGFPAQSHAPWDQVYLGHDSIIGEKIINGITLRIEIKYDDIGILQQTQKTDMDGMELDLVTKHKSAVYHCGKHPYKPLATYIDRLKKVAMVVDTVNSKIPSGSQWRTDLVVIGKGVNEAFRIANGKGVLELDSDNINTKIILDSVAHEAAHGVFEHHNSAGDVDVTKRVPDNFALTVANVFVQLQNTKVAIIPSGKFDARIKPTLPPAGGNGQPAGLLMVWDTLWSGKGGHPWDGVDEFFASAYGAYTQDKRLLNTIIDHYSSYDPAIKSIKPVLINLLKKTGDQKEIKRLTAPANNAAGIASLGAAKPVPDHTKPVFGLDTVNTLINPSLLKGPAAIKC